MAIDPECAAGMAEAGSLSVWQTPPYTCQFSHSVQSTKFTQSLISLFGSMSLLGTGTERRSEVIHDLLPCWDLCTEQTF